MARYVNISSIATTTLIAKNTNRSGSINKITIANHDNSDLVIISLHEISAALPIPSSLGI